MSGTGLLPAASSGLAALVALVVFGVVYTGMLLGSPPRMMLDLSGAELTRRTVALPLTPRALMGLLITLVALLSAVFSNDIVCLAMAPVLATACVQRRLDPVPYLLGLACAASIGSAATLIGNPQNMQIGEMLKLPSGAYLQQAAVPVLASLAALWWWLSRDLPAAPGLLPAAALAQAGTEEAPTFDRWQTTKGLAVALALVGVFLFTDWPRDVAALAGAGVLLLSRRFHTSRVMGLVDWELLLLFIGLFVVNHALEQTGLTRQAVAWLTAQGLALGEPGPLFAATLLLSNLVSNVTAVMLLLPLADGPGAGHLLALVSTLAGNLLVVGSIANIIVVVDAARRHGILIDWRRHARTGVPVTLLSLGLCAAWLAWRA